MTSHDDFFQKKKPAAVLKHRLLAEYTRVFASMVGSRVSGPIWIIDGYAGAGAYEDESGQPSAEGSPLVVLRTTASLRSRDVRAVFIESDPDLARKLDANVEPFRQLGRQVSVLNGDVHSRIAEAWALVAGQPVVTFLDPFGVAMQRDTMCGLLLNRRPGERPSEVLLNINLEAVRRIGGNLELRRGEVVPKLGQEAGVERADAFFGGDWWRRHFFENRLDSASAALAANAVIDEYRRQVKSLTGRDSMSIEVRRRPNHLPLFLLTLFYSHPVAGYKFADAAARATASWRAAFLAEELDDLEQAPETLFGRESDAAMVEADFKRQEARLRQEWVDLICENILKTPGASLEVSSDLLSILGSTIGLAGESQLKSAWDRLASAGQVAPRDKSREVHKQRIIPVQSVDRA